MAYQPPPPNQNISGQNLAAGTNYASGQPFAHPTNFPPAGASGYPSPQANFPLGSANYGESHFQNPGAAPGYPQSVPTASGYANPQMNVAAPGYPQSVPAASGYANPQMNVAAQPTASMPGNSAMYPQPSANSISSQASMKISKPPPIAGPCTSKIELRISCKNLLDTDVLSKSDPMVVLYIKHQNIWYEVGRTENIKNCLNPEFTKPIVCDYYFEEVQQAKFEVFDIDNSTPELDDDDMLGRAEFTIAEIVSSKVISRNLQFRKGLAAGRGSITISVEEVDAERNEEILLSFSAKGLDKKDFLGKSDPFLEFRRKTINGSWQLVNRTEAIKQNLNPTWRTMSILKSTLCGKNPEEEIKISCFDYDDDGGHDFIGECSTTLLKMIEGGSQPVTWTLINSKKLAKKGKSYKGSGTLILSSCKVLKLHSFLDYITNGTKLNFIVAIDFTASNGDPKTPQSLHYINHSYPNEYMRAIISVGNVLQEYDSDKMYPALGFGAKIPPQYAVSHEFALNFNMSNPFCSGVDGLLQAYSNCLQQIQLYGPTNASPIIHHAARFAQKAQNENLPNDYFVLLILTDGVITDMSATRDAIVAASTLPLSIIIVGVGGANFADMNALDGDDGVLRASNGTLALRDIVQFVPFRKYNAANPALLAKEVLAEIPQQLTGYYKRRGLSPKQAT